MTQKDAFGGHWTQDKLDRLKDYLTAYVKVFKNQDWAKTVYVDAFAGTGSIPPRERRIDDTPSFDVIDLKVQNFLVGSARVALGIEPQFGEYLFNDWIDEFYKAQSQGNLFDGAEPGVEKIANYEALAAYFVKRLSTIFPQVAKNPLTQRNSENSPMFMLCFAAENAMAVEIAHHVLAMRSKRR